MVDDAEGDITVVVPDAEAATTVSRQHEACIVLVAGGAGGVDVEELSAHFGFAPNHATLLRILADPAVQTDARAFTNAAQACAIMYYHRAVAHLVGTWKGGAAEAWRLLLRRVIMGEYLSANATVRDLIVRTPGLAQLLRPCIALALKQGTADIARLWAESVVVRLVDAWTYLRVAKARGFDALCKRWGSTLQDYPPTANGAIMLSLAPLPPGTA